MKAEPHFGLMLLVLMTLTPPNAYCGSRWDEFLMHPGDERLRNVTVAIVSSAKPCSGDVAPSQAQRTQLFGLISDGNAWAFRAALPVSQCWDGGEKEDFDRSVGCFLEKHPRAFLQIAQNGKVPQMELSHMVTTLPLDTVDSVYAKISAVQKRISALNAVQDASLIGVKSASLAALGKQEGRLNQIRVGMQK